MSRAIVDSLADSANKSFELLSNLIDALPDALWVKSAGGWPTWQHVAHCVSGADLFVPGPQTPAPAGLTAEILQLKTAGSEPPAKEVMKAYLAAVVAKVESFVKTMDDAALPNLNDGLAAIGLPWDLTTTLAVLASHTTYHLGHGDALLRQEGLPWVF